MPAAISRRLAISVLAAPLVGCGTHLTSGTQIEVFATPGATTGMLHLGALSFPCTLGRSGIRSSKQEGDGATPAGQYPLREVRYRPDRLAVQPRTALPVIATRPTDGWCDDPADANYNKLVQLPYPHSAERMWRDDQLYDVLTVIGYNDSPRRPGAGSAIFLHIMRPDGGPTSGCVALAREHVLAVLARCGPGTSIRIATA